MKVTAGIPEYELIAPKEAMISWRHDPITRQVLDIVQQEIAHSGQRVGHGETLGENVAQLTARAVGYTEGLEFLEAIFKLRDVVEDKEDDDDKGKKDTPAVRKLRNS